MEEENLEFSKNSNKNNIHHKIDPVSFFKLLYYFLTPCDILIVYLGIVGSFGTGISLPLFSLFFGETISNLNTITSIQQFKDYFYEMFLKFIFVGLSTLVGGILMYTLWTYIGKTISKRLKQKYFAIILKQEQSWFDMNNTYEYSFKIQTQIKAIEEGVNYFYLNNKDGRKNRSCYNGLDYVYFIFYCRLLYFLET